jgi:hypothetical protein
MALLSVPYQDAERRVLHNIPRSKGLVQMAQHSETQAQSHQGRVFFPMLEET